MGHHQLTQTHREILASLIAGNLSIRRIAGILGYAPSSISRELKRNSGKDGKYQADMAQRCLAEHEGQKGFQAYTRAGGLRPGKTPGTLVSRTDRGALASAGRLPQPSLDKFQDYLPLDTERQRFQQGTAFQGVWEISSSEAARKSLFQAHQVRCPLSARFAGHRRPPRRQYLWSLGMRSHTWSSAFRLYPDGCGTQKRLSHGCILPDAKRGVRLFLPEGAVFLRPRTLSAYLDL